MSGEGGGRKKVSFFSEEPNAKTNSNKEEGQDHSLL